MFQLLVITTSKLPKIRQHNSTKLLITGWHRDTNPLLNQFASYYEDPCLMIGSYKTETEVYGAYKRNTWKTTCGNKFSLAFIVITRELIAKIELTKSLL